jgi:hypothetical protein
MKYGFAFILLLVMFSCHKSESFMNNAEITGVDRRYCQCCGGLEITIDNVPNPNGNDFFLINKMPSNFQLPENPNFPIPVKIDWQKDSVKCFGNFVDITRIAYR